MQTFQTMQGLNQLWTREQLLATLRALLLLLSIATLVWTLRMVHYASVGHIYGQIPDLTMFTPWLRLYAQSRKGIELPVLFAALLSLCLGVWVCSRYFSTRLKQAFHSLPSLLLGNFLALFAIVFFLFPGKEHSVSTFFHWELHPSLLGFSLFIAFSLIPYGRKYSYPLIGFLIVVICTLISTSPFSLYNYSYIIEPAMRALAGQSLSEVVSQYDVLLPLSISPFIAQHWDLNQYKVLLQIANTIFNVWMFYALYKVVRKEVFLFAVILFILAKYHLNLSDATKVPQVSFLRLEIWLPLYVLVRRYGLVSIAPVLYLLVMIVLSKTFATIFAGMYLGYLVLRKLSGSQELSWKRIMTISLILVSVAVLAQLFFSNARLSDYLRFQISFWPLGTQSFFWVVAPLLIFCAGLIFSQKGEETNNYNANGLLIFLCCGALVYFLGRSHENNLLNISSILIFTLAIALNYLSHEMKLLVPVLSLISAFFVTDVATEVKLKLDSFAQNGLNPHMPFAAGDFSALQSAPNFPAFFDGKSLYCFPNSSLELYFYHYQLGNYKKLPIQQFRTCSTILYMQDLQSYARELETNGYQLQVINSPEF
ncbi:hypothetical protein H8K35_09350 [Undibacterium sp. LX40W]|uniref:Uncharacterized protein n=1 Tax=Undibacterium nitidum TaxID=2762298 RepID=A0A923KSM5_9BURK|nr:MULTISPECIES: hypothetical protein [Undibacterium]MBC3881356.1 hypothetical protein [Undibacterium nitidum]MBC3891861.1 hypothetical protein [Undibacterium sp. LX40W]